MGGVRVDSAGQFVVFKKNARLNENKWLYIYTIIQIDRSMHDKAKCETDSKRRVLCRFSALFHVTYFAASSLCDRKSISHRHLNRLRRSVLKIRWTDQYTFKQNTKINKRNKIVKSKKKKQKKSVDNCTKCILEMVLNAETCAVEFNH